ncbi:MAG: terminase family protein [Candidatus Berkelbacteria bacterium]|nr:terminase family protein [Candidatus Berkelbacteria bacterium]
MNSVDELSEEKQRDLLVKQVAKEHLIDFAIYVDPNYQDTWFHETIANILEEGLKKVEQGEDVRVILECPPQHGKSDLSTKKFPAWVLGKHPDWPVMVGSYSSDLALQFGQETRDVMYKPAYQDIFQTRLRADTKAKGRWLTEQEGGYTAAGAGGAFTGRGFKIGVVDDLFKNREEAESQVVRDSRWGFYKTAFYTRQRGVTLIVVIGTRWHTDDVIGRLIAKQKEDEENGVKDYDKWTIIKFPAIAVQDEKHRKKGEALWPEQFSIEKLRKTENALGPYDFVALFQQEPITSENQEFKHEWIKKRNWHEVEVLNTRKFATIDPGGSKDGNDYTGVVRNYVDQQNNWNFKAYRMRLDPKEIINVIFQLHQEGFEKIGIEETMYTKAIEPFLKDEMRKRGQFPNIVPLKHNQTDKNVRIRGLIPRYASGSTYHIEGECGDLESEAMVFPKGANDDVLDAAAYQLQLAEAPATFEEQRGLIRKRQESARERSEMA